jgi:hypothetical protein
MRPTSEQQRSLDSRYYDTGLEEMGIGFKHDQPSVPNLSPLDLHQDGCACRECEPQPQDVLSCEDYDPDQYDPLNTARGCINGCLIGLVMWAVIVWGLYEWLKP